MHDRWSDSDQGGTAGSQQGERCKSSESSKCKLRDLSADQRGLRGYTVIYSNMQLRFGLTGGPIVKFWSFHFAIEWCLNTESLVEVQNASGYFGSYWCNSPLELRRKHTAPRCQDARQSYFWFLK